jgi:ribose transport system permease protein
MSRRGLVTTSVTRRRVSLGSLVTKVLVGSGFVPVWIALGVLLVVAALVAPDTLSSDSFSTLLPLATFLGVASLGEMLVIMTGGIDLSIPGALTLAAYLVVGVSGGGNGGLAGAILLALVCAALIGAVNGVLIGVAGLNPLIVTLAVGQIVLGVATSYSAGIPFESAVPPALASWATRRLAGVSWLFWVGVAITVLIALSVRYTPMGRRFQAVGANPRAAWINGIHVRAHIVFAYAGASVLYAGAGVLLAGFIQNPSLDLGDSYLLGPIAAVVIGGASLAGGLASVTSTWVAAFALTLLSQMLRVLGLSTALQYVVFGAAIVGGMVISGERIVGVLGALLQNPRIQARFLAGGPERERRDALQETAGPA